MKHTMLALAAVAGLAFGAKAAPLSATGFEDYPTGAFSVKKGDAGGDDITEGNPWNASKYVADDGNTVTEYGDAVRPTEVPDEYTNAVSNAKFLKVDSQNGIERYVKAGGTTQDLASNVYFDMDVQFTVSDTVQDTTDGEDKLLVWLYGPEDGATNLIITAATVDDEWVPTKVDYVVPASGVFAIQPDTWHRLTVVATTKEVNSVAVPFFEVYIDNTKAVASSKLVTENNVTTIVSLGENVTESLFGSLVQVNDQKPATTTLTSVTFKGTGAIDDVVVTLEPPSFIGEGPVETMYFQVGDDTFKTFAEALEEGTTITMLANYDVANEGEEVEGLEVDENVTLNLGTFTLSSTVAAHTISVSKGTLTLLGTGSLTAYASTAQIQAASDDVYCSVYVEGALVIGNADGVPTVASVMLGSTGSVKYYGTAGTKPTVCDEDGETIVGTWEAEAGETGYYVFTAGEEPGDTTKVIDPATESLSAEGTIAVPAGTTAITLEGADVTAGFTIEGTTATIKTPVVEATGVAEDANEEEGLVVTDNQVKIGVKAVQGLYYGVGTSTDVKQIARPATLIKFTGDNRAVIFTKTKTANEDAEFYKVYVDIKATVAE